MPYDRELDAALDAARRAGRLIRAAYDALVPVENPPVDLTTETDRASQEEVLRHLTAAFPADALCAEEATPTLAAAARDGARLWVVDPIDGTRGFATKNGEFSVMIALLAGGTPAVGVVYEPALDRCTFAVRGGGCFVTTAGGGPRPCRVTATARLADATLTQSHTRGPAPGEVAVKLAPARVVETYSAGVKLALVARGEADLYVNTYAAFHDWDICAGHILVTEAGGTVTELDGGPVRYTQPGHKQRGGLIASNGAAHAGAVARLRG